MGERFNANAFWIEALRRSFHDCREQDVVTFLRMQGDRFGSEDWQLKQASSAIVLFLRNVIGQESIDARHVWEQLQDARPMTPWRLCGSSRWETGFSWCSVTDIRK